MADPITEEAFVLDVVHFLRGLGFFAGLAGRSDEDAAAALWAEHREKWEGHLRPIDRLSEMVIGSWDEDRVWWEDVEWMGDLETMYPDVLQGWARISRGAFRPTDIVQSCEDPEGPVTVEFTAGGQRHRLVSESFGDWIDSSILDYVKRLVAPSGLELADVDTTDQTAFLVAVTPAEKARFSSRGWRFPEPAPPPPPKPERRGLFGRLRGK